jgi:transposase-like protein
VNALLKTSGNNHTSCTRLNIQSYFNVDLNQYKKQLKQLVLHISTEQEENNDNYSIDNTPRNKPKILKNKKYTIDDKLSIVNDYLQSNCVETTAIKYSIPPATLQRWINILNDDQISEIPPDLISNTHDPISQDSNTLGFLSNIYLTLPPYKPGGPKAYNENDRMAVSYISTMTTQTEVARHIRLPVQTIWKWIRKFKEKRSQALDFIRKTDPSLHNDIMNNRNKYPAFIETKPPKVKLKVHTSVPTYNISQYTCSRRLDIVQEAINFGNTTAIAKKYKINPATLLIWVKKIDLLKDAVENDRETLDVKKRLTNEYDIETQKAIAFEAGGFRMIAQTAAKYNLDKRIVVKWMNRYKVVVWKKRKVSMCEDLDTDDTDTSVKIYKKRKTSSTKEVNDGDAIGTNVDNYTNQSSTTAIDPFLPSKSTSEKVPDVYEIADVENNCDKMSQDVICNANGDLIVIDVNQSITTIKEPVETFSSSKSINKDLQSSSNRLSRTELQDIVTISDDNDSLCSVSTELLNQINTVANETFSSSKSINKELKSSSNSLSRTESQDIVTISDEMIFDDNDSLCSVSSDGILKDPEVVSTNYLKPVECITPSHKNKIIGQESGYLPNDSSQLNIHVKKEDALDGQINNQNDGKSVYFASHHSIDIITSDKNITTVTSISASNNQNITTNAAYMLFRQDYVLNFEEELLEVDIKKLWDNLDPDEKDDYIEESLGLI